MDPDGFQGDCSKIESEYDQEFPQSQTAGPHLQQIIPFSLRIFRKIRKNIK